jgi:SnoaL-like protein
MGAGVLCLITSGVVASMARAQANGDPAATVTAYEMARNRRDVDAALSYFADNAVITQRNTTFSGHDEIRKFLDQASSRSRFIVVSDRKVNGTHVSWIERSGGAGTEPQGRPPQGLNSGALTANSPATAFTVNVEAVVQDGKIQSMAYLFGTQAARPDPALEGRAQLPAGFGLAAVVAVLLTVLMVASTGVRRPGRVPSSLNGRMMHDLQGWAEARQ